MRRCLALRGWADRLELYFMWLWRFLTVLPHLHPPGVAFWHGLCGCGCDKTHNALGAALTTVAVWVDNKLNNVNDTSAFFNTANRDVQTSLTCMTVACLTIVNMAAVLLLGGSAVMHALARINILL